MADRFSKFYTNTNDPASNAFAITSDSENDLANSTRAIYVGTTGDLTVTMVDSGTANTFVTFATVPAGTVLPIRVQRVSAATTANNLVGMF